MEFLIPALHDILADQTNANGNTTFVWHREGIRLSCQNRGERWNRCHFVYVKAEIALPAEMGIGRPSWS